MSSTYLSHNGGYTPVYSNSGRNFKFTLLCDDEIYNLLDLSDVGMCTDDLR